MKSDVLLIQCDQMNPFYAPPYGDATAIMPGVSRLANEGVVFENAYCNNPLCAPSRASMFSGRLVSNLRCAFDNGSEFSSEIPTFAHMLNSAGYRTVLSGKMHFIGPDQRHGLAERLTTDIYPSDFVWSPAGWNSETPTHPDMGSRAYDYAGSCEENVQLEYDEMVHRRGVDRLKELLRDDSPFCMIVSYTHPHPPFMCPPEYFQLYDGADVKPPEPGSAEASLDEFNEFIMWTCGFRKEVPQDLRRRILQSYYGMLTYVDDKVSELLALVDRHPERDVTVIFTSDHGEMMGRYGLHQKRTYYEDSVRIPLVVRNDKRFSPHRVDAPVSLVDLFPTLADLSDTDWPWTETDGRSFTPLLAGETDDSRSVISEYYGECIPYPYRLVVRDGLKFVQFPGGEQSDLLFETGSVPEKRVEVSDPGFAETTRRLREELEEDYDHQTLVDLVAESHRNRARIRGTYGNFRPDWNFGETEEERQRFIRGK